MFSYELGLITEPGIWYLTAVASPRGYFENQRAKLMQVAVTGMSQQDIVEMAVYCISLRRRPRQFAQRMTLAEINELAIYSARMGQP